ncbi:type I-E CRISPR-associated protein Cse1/CasA [Leptospira noguchii]|uniref:CRISPR-associated protein CasA/Cse1, type TIGR02547-like protein n=1 Tax=Leptospira noguchii str. 2001034031 TaxID=1193053 RepID=M6Y3J2_9LEPT|nr:type I-E CRISPR-associated protein Cse1/CasA [Leptospira noguchii]EMO88902.1 CRISPR-associated protein CasA/Cse1, type TIGR02547-like protein [Leptospira noguchii str. 2001034031]
MNLLQDKWITVVRKNGEAEKIAPFEITDKIVTNPILEIITPRPDFKGALYQFLIGLFQTVYAPKDESEWEDRLNRPPKPEILKLETDKVAFAFDLFGKKIRFMQDMREPLKTSLLDFQLKIKRLEPDAIEVKNIKKMLNSHFLNIFRISKKNQA